LRRNQEKNHPSSGSSLETKLQRLQELEITFGTGGLALPKFGAEKRPGGEAPSS
jgi:hypothetical protein